MKFAALDLELNNAPDGSTPNPKIIQIGLVIADPMQSEEEWDIRKWFIKIDEPVYPFITELTTITDEMLAEYGVTLKQAATGINQVISAHEAFVNPVTWGGGDLDTLRNQVVAAGGNLSCFGRRIIDVKTLHVALEIAAKGKPDRAGLASAMQKYKMKFEGRQHLADVDAFNTMRLYFKILNRFQLWQGIGELLKKET